MLYKELQQKIFLSNAPRSTVRHGTTRNSTKPYRAQVYYDLQKNLAKKYFYSLAPDKTVTRNNRLCGTVADGAEKSAGKSHSTFLLKTAQNSTERQFTPPHATKLGKLSENKLNLPRSAHRTT